MARGDYSPDWRDSGRRGSVVIDGEVLFCEIVADDVITGGEEEIPIWSLNMDDGRHLSFWDHDETFQYEDGE